MPSPYRIFGIELSPYSVKVRWGLGMGLLSSRAVQSAEPTLPPARSGFTNCTARARQTRDRRRPTWGRA